MITGGAIWEAPRTDWDWVLGVNVHGVLNGIRSFVPRMLGQNEEGHVVNVASMAGVTAMPFSSVYCVSKHAVVVASECLHHELAIAGDVVKCSVLCPEGVHTDINTAARNRPWTRRRKTGCFP